jgi:guanylate kinase
MRKKGGVIFVISGPSGSGKTTLIKSLLEDRNLKKALVKSISFTTRPKRRNEKKGKDYFFITPQRFKALRKQKKIVEWTKHLDYYYATPKDYIDAQLKKGRCLALCLDTKGAASIRGIYPKSTITIFVLPPKIEVLKERIRSRSKEIREKDLLLRLSLAKKEIFLARHYDYRIVNDNFQSALKQLKEIIRKEIGC